MALDFVKFKSYDIKLNLIECLFQLKRPNPYAL